MKETKAEKADGKATKLRMVGLITEEEAEAVASKRHYNQTKWWWWGMGAALMLGAILLIMPLLVYSGNDSSTEFTMPDRTKVYVVKENSITYMRVGETNYYRTDYSREGNMAGEAIGAGLVLIVIGVGTMLYLSTSQRKFVNMEVKEITKETTTEDTTESTAEGTIDKKPKDVV